MSENIDYKIIKGRYVFPGKIKVPVKTIERLPKDSADNTIRTISQLAHHIKESQKSNKNFVVTANLTNKDKLYVDYRNNNLNLYLETPNTFTQIINDKALLKIAWKEKFIKDKVNDLTLNLEKQSEKDYLTATLLHAACRERDKNLRDTKVFGKDIDDSMELD